MKRPLTALTCNKNIKHTHTQEVDFINICLQKQDDAWHFFGAQHLANGAQIWQISAQFEADSKYQIVGEIKCRIFRQML